LKLIDLAKRLPVDLGQGNLRTTTKGKLIALDLVPDGTDRRALDVGCREGDQTRWLEARGYEVTSIDIEPAFEGCQMVDVNEGLPFSDGSFDLVWCSEVIEHLHDTRRFADEVERVLRPRGKLVLTTPNSGFWLYWMGRFLGLKPRDLQNPGHIHFFRL
jgi:2-polyprenyl-3-methyl-5-hydroxy-6-metoxy-1,4-benzoquinol methylase